MAAHSLMAEYYVTHVGGLEDIVGEEIAERLPNAIVFRSEYGRRHLRYDGDPALLLTLRTVENVYIAVREIEHIRPEQKWLDDLETFLAATDLSPALTILRRVRPIPDPPTFRVTAERLGEHDFRSPEVAGAAGAGIVARTGWQVKLKGFDVEVRVDVRDDRALIGVRLSAQALHKRSRVVHPRVTLNPTVAAAMVRLSQPQAGELVVDPMCGGGTLLTERYAHDARVRLLGGDRFPEKVALARENFAALEVPAQLVQWDAARLPLAEAVVDKFLCNPPWGRLIASPRLNRHLYPWLLRHIARCLRPGGLAVILTSERALMQRASGMETGLRLVYVKRLSLGGLAPSLHVLRKEASTVEGEGLRQRGG